MSKEYSPPDYIPTRQPIAKIARRFKRLLEKFAKEAYQCARDFEYNDDDPDYYKYSAFFANASGAGDDAEDAVEFYPEDDPK